MDTKEALRKLYKIAKTQQGVLERLAQQMGGAPMAGGGGGTAPAVDQRTAKLRQHLYTAMPEAKKLFLGAGAEEPNVKDQGSGGKVIVFYKYRSTNHDAALKAAITEAANAILGPGTFILQGTGLIG
jgi:hypothetical protein